MSIQRRKVFCEKRKDGVFRFHDYAVVTTTLGAMVEPFCQIGTRKVPGSNFDTIDWSDEMTRIDEIEFIDLDRANVLLSFGSESPFIGGLQLPRTGR